MAVSQIVSQIAPVATIVGAIITVSGTLVWNIYNQKRQTYIDQISHLKTYEDLRTSHRNGYKRAVMREKMKTLLLQLDEERKGILLSFLHGTKLIRREEITPYEHTKKGRKEKGKERWRYPILRLSGIDLSRAKLEPGATLAFNNLSSIVLRGAKLSEVDLSGANLRNADLRDADLSGAVLRKPDPVEDPEEDPEEEENEVKKAKNPDGSHPEGLLETDLSGADLTGADLTRADLTGAIVTKEQLGTARSLQGATMTDGSRHE
jgi:hypothetical protein